MLIRLSYLILSHIFMIKLLNANEVHEMQNNLIILSCSNVMDIHYLVT